MSKDPSFPLYARDWLTATRTMTAPARAAYIDLICHEWLSGPLPDDPELLRRVCAMDRDEFLSIWPEVKAKLTKTQNNQWVSERLETIRDERGAFSEKQRLNGMKGGRPKTHFEPTENPNETQPITQTKPKRNPRANPNHNPKKALHSASASASPIASSLAESPLTPQGELGDALADWLAYKKEKGQAYKPKGLAALIKKLEEMPDAVAAIRHSMAMNYTGVFPERPHVNGKPSKETIYEKAVRLGGV